MSQAASSGELIQEIELHHNPNKHDKILLSRLFERKSLFLDDTTILDNLYGFNAPDVVKIITDAIKWLNESNASWDANIKNANTTFNECLKNWIIEEGPHASELKELFCYTIPETVYTSLGDKAPLKEILPEIIAVLKSISFENDTSHKYSQKSRKILKPVRIRGKHVCYYGVKKEKEEKGWRVGNFNMQKSKVESWIEKGFTTYSHSDKKSIHSCVYYTNNADLLDQLLNKIQLLSLNLES